MSVVPFRYRTRRTHLAVRLRTLPLWPGSGVLSSGVTRKSARLVALASFDPPAAAAVPLRRAVESPNFRANHNDHRKTYVSAPCETVT
jgi:hypothetical protein